MGNALGSWSGMRKYLEREMLASSLQGRVRYGCTRYVGMDGFHIFEVCVDGRQVKRFAMETLNTYFIAKGYKSKETDRDSFWDEYMILKEKYPVTERSEFTDSEFCDALEYYRNHAIGDCIYHENPMVRMFSVLDRRIGKRTLLKLRDELDTQPKWLQEFYQLRFKAEGI